MSTIDIPEHLNRKYFITALEEGLKEKDIEISNLEFSMGSGVGENFLSCIYRVKVTYTASKSQPKIVSLIVKNCPAVQLIPCVTDIHLKETTMYFKILPQMEGTSKGVRIAPKVYYSSTKPPKTMVLEDMKETGYRLGNRQSGLDEDHCRIVLEKLGKFHALSMIYASKNPKDMEEFEEGTTSANSVRSPGFEMVFGHNFKSTIKEAANWPGFENITKKLRLLEPHFADRVVDCVDNSKDTFKVLNHGDMWINNLLFKYSYSNQIEEVIFIDFQGSVYASPGLDINYFLSTSTQPEVIETRRDYMVENYYYKAFRQTLENAGYDPVPTRDEIVREVRKKEFFGLSTAIGLLPLLSMDSNISQNNSVEKLTTGETQSNLDSTCTSPRFQKTMKFLLKSADNAGILD